MALVRKENAAVGLTVYACYDDGPFDPCGYREGVITDVFDDHYLYKEFEFDIDNIWGFYDTDLKNDSVAVFTKEEDAKEWVNLHNNRSYVINRAWER